MTTTKAIIAFVLAVVISGAIYGLVVYLNPQQITASASPAGTNLNDSKQAAQIVATGTTTVYAILNTDASDRIVTGSDWNLNNSLSTTTTTTITCATSTSASQITAPATSDLLSMKLNANMVGTTTFPGMYVSTSSPGITGSSTVSSLPTTAGVFARDWQAGSWLVCQATTGDGYNAFTPGTTGFIAFPYKGT